MRGVHISRKACICREKVEMQSVQRVHCASAPPPPPHFICARLISCNSWRLINTASATRAPFTLRASCAASPVGSTAATVGAALSCVACCVPVEVKRHRVTSSDAKRVGMTGRRSLQDFAQRRRACRTQCAADRGSAEFSTTFSQDGGVIENVRAIQGSSVFTEARAHRTLMSGSRDLKPPGAAEDPGAPGIGADLGIQEQLQALGLQSQPIPAVLRTLGVIKYNFSTSVCQIVKNPGSYPQILAPDHPLNGSELAFSVLDTLLQEAAHHGSAAEASPPALRPHLISSCQAKRKFSPCTRCLCVNRLDMVPGYSCTR